MAICSKNLRQKIRNYRFAVKNAIEKDQNDFLGDRFFSLLIYSKSACFQEKYVRKTPIKTFNLHIPYK